MFKSDQTIAEIVSEDFRTAGVFKKHHVDFCCGGKKPLTDVCKSKGLSELQLLKELNEAVSKNLEPGTFNFSGWSPALLIAYIQDQHHNYVKEALPRIQGYLQKVAYRHGETQTELVKIYNLFLELSKELMDHTSDEENRVFPAIIDFIGGSNKREELLPEFMNELVDEHTVAGDIMMHIRNLSNNFTPPEWACNTYRVAFAELEAFELDLHQHVHLENNLLFEKVSESLNQHGIN
jgi:regulator of cell morphogenesis and NO signaling